MVPILKSDEDLSRIYNRSQLDMEDVRTVADEAEKLAASNYWPYPSYSDMLYRVKYAK